jgi:hypothetical protein
MAQLPRLVCVFDNDMRRVPRPRTLAIIESLLRDEDTVARIVTGKVTFNIASDCIKPVYEISGESIRVCATLA